MEQDSTKCTCGMPLWSRTIGTARYRVFVSVEHARKGAVSLVCDCGRRYLLRLLDSTPAKEPRITAMVAAPAFS